jgi:hypothetical protein
MLADRLGNEQLGADAIGAGHQDGVAKACRLEIKQTAKATERRVGAGPGRGARQRCDGIYQRVAGRDIDPGIFVGLACDGPPALALEQYPLIWNRFQRFNERIKLLDRLKSRAILSS